LTPFIWEYSFCLQINWRNCSAGSQRAGKNTKGASKTPFSWLRGRDLNPLSAKSREDEKYLVLIYTIEGVKDDWVFVRAQVQRIQGSDAKTLDDMVIKMRLPTKMGEPVDYAVKLTIADGKEIFPVVHFKFVVLERLSPSDLILATAATPESTS
jgi:hypothetical protein